MKLDDKTREEAAAWFAALRRGPMSLDERAAFDAWRADPRNQSALHGMHELWGEVSALKELGVGVPSPAAARWRKVAAGVAVAAVLAGGSFIALQPFGQRVQTGVGEQRVANLADGSVVGLNVVTRVSYDLKKPERRLVRLEDGEAVFYVRKNAARPFVVRAGDYEIRALGTAFNVRCRDDFVDVAVIQGWVSVRAVSGPRAGEEIARLKAGEKLKLDPAGAGEGAPAPEPVAVGSVAEWRLRIVGYEDASVATVVEDLNRFFDRPIVVRDAELAGRRVTIRLQVEDRERTLRTLGALLGAQIEPQGRADLLAPAATS